MVLLHAAGIIFPFVEGARLRLINATEKRFSLPPAPSLLRERERCEGRQRQMGNPVEADSSNPQPLPSEADNAGSERYPKDLSGEPWDQFEMWLEIFRASIVDFCITYLFSKRHPEINAFFLGGNTYPDEWVDDDWIERTRARLAGLNNSKEEQLWLEQTQKAWEHLRTAQNRLRALQLLHDAAEEVVQQVFNGPRFWQVTKKKRESQQRVLRKARAELEKTINAAGHALLTYLKAVRAIEAFPHRPMMRVFEGGLFDQKKTYGPSEEIRECLKMQQQIVDRLNRFVEPSPFAKGPGRRGRREKSRLSAAVIELQKIFRDGGLSRNKALGYTHSLLYIAGIWPDDDPHSLSGKFSQLQRRSPQACSPSKEKPVI